MCGNGEADWDDFARTERHGGRFCLRNAAARAWQEPRFLVQFTRKLYNFEMTLYGRA
jgi:hypothetical protein